MASHDQPGRDVGAVVRQARVAAGLRQGELGRRCGYSASQISRWETGAAPLRDVAVLRALARALDLPATAVGLTDADTSGAGSHRSPVAPPTVGRAMSSMSEEDDVRRRSFLLTAGLLLATGEPAAASAPASDPAGLLTRGLVGVLLGPTGSTPAPVAALRSTLARAQQEFVCCHYLPLAGTLPDLIAAAEATVSDRPGHDTQQTLAQTYHLTSRVLGKLQASNLEGVAADRGLRAAQASGDPLLVAESHRLVGGAARRGGHHQRAHDVTLSAIEVLDTGDHPAAAQHWAMWSRLHCSGGYAAALTGDRDHAAELLDLADTAVTHLADDAQRRAAAANIVSHRVSAALVLGDAGAAIAHAHRQPLAAVPTVERRARLLVDVAQAYAQWDKPDRALASLLVAERAAPEEVHTRSAVRRLVLDLARSPRAGGLRELPALAARVHARI